MKNPSNCWLLTTYGWSFMIRDNNPALKLFFDTMFDFWCDVQCLEYEQCTFANKHNDIMLERYDILDTSRWCVNESCASAPWKSATWSKNWKKSWKITSSGTGTAGAVRPNRCSGGVFHIAARCDAPWNIFCRKRNLRRKMDRTRISSTKYEV